MTSKQTLVVIVALGVFVTAGFLLWRYKFAQKTALPSQAFPTISPVNVGKDISSKIVNPSLPQTNPFGAKTNPFTGSYKNPFSK